MKFHNKIVERLLPQNTRRRKTYDIGIAGGKSLINEGYHTLYHSVARYFNKNNELSDYKKWIKKNEPISDEFGRLKKISHDFSFRPKISLITPVWNTGEKWLRLAIDSVINQTYDNWELCLADGGSTKPHIQSVLREYANKDPRIKIKFLEKNEGIAGNSNEALSLASGDFIGFLDHDDELAPFALHEVVCLLNKNRNLDFLYSDEDKIDEFGRRKDPFFKPEWSPDMFLSYNYLCHFSIIRKSLVDSSDGFRKGYEGSQDYDLFLRITEKIPPKTLAHIPKILYHWRMIRGSSAKNPGAKQYAFAATKKALNDALLRRGISASVEEGIFPGPMRIRYAILDNPRVSIIIPSKDRKILLQKCVESILSRTEYRNYEIVIIDNNSTEQETIAYYNTLKNDDRIRILYYDKPFNFSAMNNFAVRQVNSPYILFLNNDTKVISGEWLTAMLEHIQREDIGAVGAKLLYPDNTVQHAGIIIGLGGIAGHSHKYYPDLCHGYAGRASVIQNVSAVTAACLLTKKELFENIGGFDEDLVQAFNDVDLCLKIREKGYQIIFTPYARLYHYESRTRGYEDSPEKRMRFSLERNLIRQKWGNLIDSGDPFYSPNLTKDREDFSIAV